MLTPKGALLRLSDQSPVRASLKNSLCWATMDVSESRVFLNPPSLSSLSLLNSNKNGVSMGIPHFKTDPYSCFPEKRAGVAKTILNPWVSILDDLGVYPYPYIPLLSESHSRDHVQSEH